MHPRNERSRRGGAAALLATVLLAGCSNDERTTSQAGVTATNVRTKTVTSIRTVTRRQPARTIVRTVTRVVTVRRPPATNTTPPAGEDTANATADPRPVSSGRPRFGILLVGATHAAQSGRRWVYRVRATIGGQPASATAKMRVFVDGELVDTIGFFAFKGELRRAHVWPRVLAGKRVVLQAEVEGQGGTRRANWPVVIR